MSFKNHGFQINIKDNPLSCECEAIPFLHWIQSTKTDIIEKESLICSDTMTKIMDKDLDNLKASCDRKRLLFIITSVLTGLIFIAVLCGILVYRYRWRLAWHAYTVKRALYCYQAPQTGFEMENRHFEAFVAYAVDDNAGCRWAVKQLLPHVEEHLDKKLHIFDRNATLGNSRIGEIIHGMKHSKNTIFVITKDFFKYYEWEMVLYWAVRRGLESVILCCLDGFTIDQMPPNMAQVAIEVQQRFPINYLEIDSGQNIAEDDRSFSDIL